MTRIIHRSHLAVAAFALALAAHSARAQDVNEADERAMKAAAYTAAPSVVKIETSGGTETIGRTAGGKSGPAQPGIPKGTGPTTGLIVAADGYIITSAFNFSNKPTDIFVSVPGRPKRFVAKVVANDRTRMLTLLKIDASDLAVPAVYPKARIDVGRWAVALGRTLDPHTDHPPSISVGIVSAKNRIWGKAIQTDAKVSPVNYGGPLVALDGRVFGVLVPASTRGEGETAGAEWYDSGIGFAIPLEDVMAALPRLKTGKDLRRGLLGITPQSASDMYNAKPLIGSILPDSAAARLGLKAGDEITWLAGHPIENYSQVMHTLGPKYEGDVVDVKVKRDGKELTFDKVTLAGTVSAYVPSFLGILPMRDDPNPGVEIRYVYAKSPADEAKLKAGDRIMKVGAPTLKPVIDRGALTTAITRLSPGTEVKLEVKRKDGGKVETVTVKLVPQPDALPDKLPLPSTVGKALTKPKETGPTPKKDGPVLPKKGKKGEDPKKPDTGLSSTLAVDPPKTPFDDPKKTDDKKDKPEVEKGLLKRTNAALGREYWVFVPRNYDPNVSHGLIVWFHDVGRGVKDAEDMRKIWEWYCEDNHFILMGPKSQNNDGWVASETESMMQDVKTVLGQYTIDKSRVVAHGMGVGGQMAFYVGFHARDVFRGVATVGAVLGTQPKDAVANQPLSFFISGGDKDPLYPEIVASKDTLMEKKFPVIFREMKDTGKEYFLNTVFDDLKVWLDSLDRI